MPTSIRLDPELEARLKAIAEIEGVPLSEVLRRAALKYIDESDFSLQTRLSDVLGVVKSNGGRARRSGAAFKRLARRRK